MIDCSQPGVCMFFNNFICGGSTFTKELNSSFEKVIADAKEMPRLFHSLIRPGQIITIQGTLSVRSPDSGGTRAMC